MSADRSARDGPSGGAAFDEVIHAEIEAIKGRRRRLDPDLIRSDIGQGTGRNAIPVVGLALSGGGIRSAAISLGVLQALNEQKVIDKIDYLSTVSGGGYIGAALSASMTASGGKFVFGGATSTAPRADEISDTKSVGHLRYYSNYLIPRGFRDVLTGSAIAVRGLVANLGFVLPIVLIAAAITLLLKPERSVLPTPALFGVPLDLPQGQFRITLAICLIGLVLFFLWALYRSGLRQDRLAEFRAWFPAFAAGYVVLIAVAAFLEFQPFILANLFAAQDKRTLAIIAGEKVGGGLLVWAASTWIGQLAVLLTPIAAIVTFFRQQFGAAIKTASASSSMRTKLVGVLARIGVWAAGLALPLLIWLGYITLVYWGTANDEPVTIPDASICCAKVAGAAGEGGRTSGNSVGADVACPVSCRAPEAAHLKPGKVGPYDHAPAWLRSAALSLKGDLPAGLLERAPLAVLYLPAGVVLALLVLLLRPNANSLHRLYRDRLAKAFLFDPTEWKARAASKDPDFKPLDTLKLSDIDTNSTPYHLVNAALNIQGSDFANRRGRNADFFMFSKLYTGSLATGYRDTSALEGVARDLDLATAMATSGAAVSANMGHQSIRALTPTLALLNIRLGYWLQNPYYDPKGRVRAPWRHRVLPFLAAEISGRLYEDAPYVYLTDGGHIENLGVYELLRRRCELIIAVDAEADPEMRFPSLIRLERYARIDLGVRIDLPWERISKVTRDWMGMGSSDQEKGDVAPSGGPHVAIGTIHYGDVDGILVYVKSSLSGDENDYVRDYARRNPSYPHETTGDQFFDEEQFEVYRALGFHMMSRFLTFRDHLEVDPGLPGTPPPPPAASSEPQAVSGTTVRLDAPVLKRVREMLGLPDELPPPK
jgi:hypothetical protein